MGSQLHNIKPSALTSPPSGSESPRSSSFESIYTNEFRSSRACDYKKTVISRGSTVVHAELARGYNSADPHPSYIGAYGRNQSSRVQRGHEAAEKAAAANPQPDSSTPSTISRPSEEHSCVDVKHVRGSTREIGGSSSKEVPGDLPQAPASLSSKDCGYSTTSSLADESILTFLSEHAITSENTRLLPTNSSIRQKYPTCQPARSHDRKSTSDCAKRSASSESHNQTSSGAPSDALTTDSRRYREYLKSSSHLVEALPSDRESESSLSADGDTGSIFTYASTAQTLSDVFEDMPRALIGECVLPCEFVGYTSCDQWFHPEHKDQWINHVMVDHLASNLPSKCSCWYCDDYDFDSLVSGFDRTTNFVQRMEHIREHIVNDGLGVDSIRPDYNFLAHLTRHGLIPKSVYEKASAWNEGPQSGVTGIYAHDFEPPQRTLAHEGSEWIVVDQQKEDHRRKKMTRLAVLRRCSGTDKIQPRAIEARQNHGTLQNLRDTNICQDAQSIQGQEGQRASTAHPPTSTSNGLIRSPPSVLSDASEEPNASVQSSQVAPSIHGLQNLEERLSGLTISSNLRNEDLPAAQKVGSPTEVHDNSDTPLFIVRSHEPPPSFASNIQLAVQRFVQSIHSEAEARFGSHQELTNTSSHRPCSIPASSKPESETKEACPPSGKPRAGKKKRKLSNDHQSESEGSDKEHEPSVTSKGKQKEDRPLFACPFFKYNRSKYGNRRYCNGPGWPDMHRLKEHLFRKHKQAMHCRRCWTPFKEQNALTAHQRDDSQCPVLSEVRIEGIDEVQEKQLRSRKAFSKMEECAKWRKVYIIIFPAVTEDEIPTPYYDVQDAHDSLESDSLEEHKSRLRQELPSHIVNALVEGLKKMHMDINTTQLQEHCTMAVDKAFEALSREGDDVTRTSNSSGPTTGDLHQLNEHAQPSTLGSISSMEILETSSDFMSSSWDTDYGLLFDDSLLRSVANTFLPLDTSDSSMESLEADADLHQNMGMGKPTSDSGYGSRADHDYHKWL